MSKKVFQTILLVALAVASFATGNVYAGVFFLGQAIGTVLPNTFGAVIAGILGGAIGLLGFFSVKLAEQPSFDEKQELGGRLTVRTDPKPPREVLIGKAGTAGFLAYRNVIEPANESDPEVIWYVLALVGFPVTSLEEFYMNDTLVSVPAGGGGPITSGPFAGKLSVYFRNGTETTQAFPALASEEGAAGKWAQKSRYGRGVATAAIRVTADEVYKNKVEPFFVMKGAPLYDPRKDTTVGGSGSHRFANESTFEWSANSVLACLNYLRGFYIKDYQNNDVLISGRGLKGAPEYFDFPDLIAEANTCDETVNVSGGGTIPRYESNGFIVPNRPLRDVVGLLDTAHGGKTVFSGKYRVYPAVWRAPTLTFDESDVVGVPKRIDYVKGPGEIINTVRGGFADATNRYQLQSYPAQKDAASIARVGEKQVNLSFPFITDHRQAQRVAWISMNLSNAPRRFSADFTHRGLRVAPGGETINITWAHYNFVNQTMRCVEWDLKPVEDDDGMPGLNIPMTLVQDEASMYAWQTSYELSRENPSRLPQTQAVPKLSQMPGTAVNDTVQQDKDGTIRVITHGAGEGEANDGDSVLFAQTWESPPMIIFEPSNLAPLAANEKYLLRADDLTVNGFTMYARIIGTGTPSTQTDTTESTPSGTVDRQIDKGIAAESDTDVYAYRYSVIAEPKVIRIPGEPDEYIDGSVTLELYSYKNGSGWTLRKTITHNSTGTFTVNVNADGLNSTADKFGIKKKSAVGDAGNGINDFIHVSYDHGGGATNVTATPSGYGPVQFKIIGGVEAGTQEEVAGVVLNMATASLTMTPQNGTFDLVNAISFTTANLTVTPQGMTVEKNVIAAQGTEAQLTLTPQAFTYVFNVTVSFASVGLTLTAQPGTFGLFINIPMATANLTITPQAFTYRFNVTASMTTATLTVTSYSGTFSMPANVVMTYVENVADTAPGSTYDFTITTSGFASGDIIAVAFGYEDSQERAITAATIGGNSLSIAVQHQSTNRGCCGILYYKFTSTPGATETLSITTGGATGDRGNVGIWKVTGFTSETPSATGTDGSTGIGESSWSVTGLNVPANTGGVAIYGAGDSGATVAWTGATERYDTTVGGGTQVSGAEIVPQGTDRSSHTVQADRDTGTNNQGVAFAVAIWS